MTNDEGIFLPKQPILRYKLNSGCFCRARLLPNQHKFLRGKTCLGYCRNRNFDI